ncbi:hypothetical protein [Vibrio nigripulchritudo]|uniref:hypothetical protein n=1 Tax=Vibrio nigripulchritudo TaxID=28173 RepID=UPI0005F9AD29|nr:hypothetical protein [Vibrio nigripulchritudo]KJY78944.1 hypothetical protein TW74_09580 [Vibrio nigripulchritudo]
MSTIYEHLFSCSFEQIKERFEKSGVEQQEEIVIQLDAIAKKLTPVQTHRSLEDVLADIKEAMQGDRASVFFAHNYVSWYRSSQSENVKPQLHHWSQLDMKNRSLFIEMLALRDLGRWDDEALYQFEQYCLSVIGK